ncbi:GNAT family N-acetyltransferase [Aeromicrobium sp. A1-2]|uniref:GNAT family N-acetyltransferase n=1 Tax=Aeromicrobium sp. A1-2 TaxID=2107713 RepID=UPI000E50F07F|nr:GNAT family N-acetyltransferase [Aeromicrobium sp. A1-2]AXT84057.1 GNAT family N-acetyltransferase [Aeromicrobium sp. A1-2]
MTGAHVLERVPFEHPDAVALREEHVAAGNQLYASDPAAVHRSGAEGMDPASIVATVVARSESGPIGHACLRRLGDELEIKRMYVVPGNRGSGVADALLAAMEGAARHEGARRVVIHTGDRQHAALKFYDRHGYTSIPVYPPYEVAAYSLCFEKLL